MHRWLILTSAPPPPPNQIHSYATGFAITSNVNYLISARWWFSFPLLFPQHLLCRFFLKHLNIMLTNCRNNKYCSSSFAILFKVPINPIFRQINPSLKGFFLFLLYAGMSCTGIWRIWRKSWELNERKLKNQFYRYSHLVKGCGGNVLHPALDWLACPFNRRYGYDITNFTFWLPPH